MNEFGCLTGSFLVLTFYKNAVNLQYLSSSSPSYLNPFIVIGVTIIRSSKEEKSLDSSTSGLERPFQTTRVNLPTSLLTDTGPGGL